MYFFIAGLIFLVRGLGLRARGRKSRDPTRMDPDHAGTRRETRNQEGKKPYRPCTSLAGPISRKQNEPGFPPKPIPVKTLLPVQGIPWRRYWTDRGSHLTFGAFPRSTYSWKLLRKRITPQNEILLPNNYCLLLIDHTHTREHTDWWLTRLRVRFCASMYVLTRTTTTLIITIMTYGERITYYINGFARAMKAGRAKPDRNSVMIISIIISTKPPHMFRGRQ